MVPITVAIATALAGLCAAAPVPSLSTRADTPKCEKPEQRKSWHDWTAEEKAPYLKGIQCIMGKPAKLNQMPGAKTRWDELVGLHQIMALQIHSTGIFLPFHRYLLHAQQFLLAECDYHGPLPYWDETRDAGKFLSSPVFDATLGFGGDGKGTQNCVSTGPFANFSINIGPGFTSQPRCVNRKITNALSSGCGAKQVAAAINYDTYEKAWVAIYNGPHLTGHMALAMMNGDSITSCGDPLFFLHHGFVDKMWADWQKVKPERLTDISGPNAQDPSTGFLEFPGGIEQESKMWGKPTDAMKAVTPAPSDGDGGPTVTLKHVMSSLGIIPNATVADVMNIKGGYLCYEWV